MFSLGKYKQYCNKSLQKFNSKRLCLVRVLDCRWNHFIPSLYLLQSKLDRFGFVLVDNVVAYTDERWNPNV